VGKDLDPFDMICPVLFDQPLFISKERANNVTKNNYFTAYSEQAQLNLMEVTSRGLHPRLNSS
jgi:type I restriction enzyme R subunit